MPDEQPEKTTVHPPTAHTPAPTTVTNGLAIASMVVGIVAFVSGWIPFWGLLAGAAAVILGILALKKPGGKGFSLTGIITGGIAALTSLLFTALFLFALIAGSANLGQVSDQLKDDTSNSQQFIDAKKDFAKGETAIFGNWEVKVNSVQRNYVPETSYYQADEGNEYIVVNLSIKNISKDSEYLSPYDISINEAGISTASSFVTVDPELKSGKLSTDASTTGNLVFEVTKDASNLKLQYETTALTDNFDSKNLVYTLAI